jgi:tetratricopeptide (TPR) repeat protein
MKICILILLFSFGTSTVTKAQRKKKKDIEKEILAGMDGEQLALKIAGDLACKCIDSVYQGDKSVLATDKAVTNCIADKVSIYDMSKQLMSSLKKKNNKIVVNTNEDSDQFKDNYYAIERRLKDSCKILNFLLKSNDKILDKSHSNNEDARKEYDKGVDYLKKEDYKNALKYFDKAVAIDSVFAFAWDNIGVCNRQLGNYEKAVAAYKESLKLEPTGKTALQNIAVAYGYLNKYDEAIASYNEILKYYPKDPEVYYGIGSIYFMKLKNNEKGLDNMCKAYIIYVQEKSAYRSDAEKIISMIYSAMKKDKKEDLFNKILKDNGIDPTVK